MRLNRTFASLLSISILAFASNVVVADCSVSDVEHYLKIGFNHEQVVKLCADEQKLKPGQETPATQDGGNAAPIATQENSEAVNADVATMRGDQIYFETVIEGDPVVLTDDKLTFERKECAVYGEVNISGLKDKACVNTLTTIYFDGLKILEASKAVLLLKAQTLLVKGNIVREYQDISKHNKYKTAEIKKQLSTHPAQLNIPVTKGIDPQDVVMKLKKYL